MAQNHPKRKSRAQSVLTQQPVAGEVTQHEPLSTPGVKRRKAESRQTMVNGANYSQPYGTKPCPAALVHHTTGRDGAVFK